MRDDGPTVREITTAVYVIPTDAPEADGTLAWDKTTMVLTSVRAGAAKGTGWTYAAAAAQSVITDVLADAVTGRGALDVAGAAEAMARAVRNVGRPGIAATAISAVDIALWDLKARLLGCSLAGLLGQARDSVPIYGSGGFTSYDDGQTRDQLAEWTEKDHIPRVKIKIGQDWAATSRACPCRSTTSRPVSLCRSPRVPWLPPWWAGDTCGRGSPRRCGYSEASTTARSTIMRPTRSPGSSQ
jgi:L-alanine-DL-glutamate epimerase-like enolase superfamily enzyme